MSMKLKFGFSLLLSFLSGGIYAQNLYFPPTNSNQWDKTNPSDLNYCDHRIDSLYKFLGDNKTKAFILLKDGKIVLEKYFDNFDSSSQWYWASAGKGLTAFMTGLAQEQGYLSIQDSSSKYLGNGWTSTSANQENQIKIVHQLSMTSGLDGEVADPFCTLPSCLEYKNPPGQTWAYHNGPYTLLDSVLEVATGRSLNLYINQQLRLSTGITGAFIKSGYNNVFYSTPRSMARFGLLMLNKGKWNQTQIMNDSNYFNAMINTSNNDNLSYGYLWWLNGKNSYKVPGVNFEIPGTLIPDAPTDLYSAMGKNGQFINIVPSQNLVWIRMGESPDAVDVPFLLNNEIWKRVNNLPCGILNSHEINSNLIEIFPNPSTGIFKIHSRKNLKEIKVYSILGELIYTKTFVDNKQSADIELSNKGLLIIEVTDEFGAINRLRHWAN